MYWLISGKLIYFIMYMTWYILIRLSNKPFWILNLVTIQKIYILFSILPFDRIMSKIFLLPESLVSSTEHVMSLGGSEKSLFILVEVGKIKVVGIHWYKLGIYTGTWLYRNTGLVASISEPVFPLLSIGYSFRYIFSPKYFKMYEVYVFCGEQGRKLERQLLFCFCSFA